MLARPACRLLALFGLLIPMSARADVPAVTGRVMMPDSCSPAISPAVVTLEPASGVKPAAEDAAKRPARAVALVNQRGLQFEPRVQVVATGQTIRFTNEDSETHNVHILTPGFPFNKSMAPRVPALFVPEKSGVIRLVCDIHSHMRGYVVVTDSPWAKVCRGGGSFRFEGVPDGEYTLKAWHEMGPALERVVEVNGGAADLGTITLEGFPAVATARAETPIRTWPEVTDRIGLLLAEARELARKPEGLARARKLAEDAYWSEFELSDMETAVRRSLGYKRAGEIEGQFLKFRSALTKVSEGTSSPSLLVDKTRQLLLSLSHASEDLNRMGITDRTKVGASTANAPVESTESTEAPTDLAGQQQALKASFDRVRDLADAGKAGDAASAMTDAYFQDFEPLERVLTVRSPGEVKPLEARFNTIRGRIDAGLAGEPLRVELAALRSEVAAAIARTEAVKVGSFGAAFVVSLATILREGVEVILLLAMLIALVAKSGQPGAMKAIRWGVGLAVAASALTAVGLNSLIAATQGQTREIIEGAVMLLATVVLFYVSYWLISQTQAKRWADFLKQKTMQGAANGGGLGTLCVTAFLAVYREGAETALMYQAMISGQGGSRPGLIGLAAGLGVGLVGLAVIVLIVRRTSARLPMRPFFKVTGSILFAMSVIFAGNGVFELQSAGIMKVTPLSWTTWSLPLLGLYPNVQSLSVQGLLLLGAAIALISPALEGRGPSAKPPVARTTPARVGV
ncbi:FTR1 family protein [Tundrisphaera sp. TA3]|uniref:FTR1 family protein n=1 Tax=Tundrisphaera sp. TA3 TaxID=3435775 RepID=UPI003EC11B70